MSPLKVRIWAERSDVMQCWVWRYSTSDGTWTTSTGTALCWRDATKQAEMQAYSQHHARPVPVLPAVIPLPVS